MYWHIETDFVCLVIMIALYINASRYDISKDSQDRLFKTISATSIIAIIIDIVASLAMDYATNWWLYQLLNMAYFISVPILILLWYYYLRMIVIPVPDKKDRITTIICSIPYFIYVLICLSNPFSGWIFKLTRDMDYSRGPLFASSILLLLFYTLISLVTIAIYRKDIYPKSRIQLFVMFYLFVIAGVYFQLSNPGWLVIYGAFTAIFVVTYFYIQNRRILSDSLTGLLARFSGVQMVTDYFDSNNNGQEAALILTDLDNFKLINDSAGHRYGDIVLRCAANACRDAFPSQAIISRLGGDEFMIMVGGYKDHAQLASWLNKVNIELGKKIAENKKEGTSDRVTMSLGVAFYPEHGSNFPELYDCADVALYQAKWQGKNKYVFYERNFQAELTDKNPLIDANDNKFSNSSKREFVPADTIQKTMLIIDDSKISREVLTSLFCDEFIMLRAEDIKTGLEQLRRYGRSITVILLDIMMPEQNGIDFLIEKNRSDAIKNVPVIAISASEDQKLLKKALEYGAVATAEKPIRAEDLRKTVKKVVDKYGEGFWYSDRYQREFLNLANTGIDGGIVCVRNEPGHPIDFISSSLLNQLGYSNRTEFFEQVQGNWENVLYPQDLPAAVAEVDQSVNNAGEYTNLEYRVMTKDGQTIWVSDNGKIVTSADGQSFIVSLCININETVTTKEKLEERIHMIDVISSVVQAGICQLKIDASLTIKMANEFYYQMLGYTYEEAIAAGFTNCRFSFQEDEYESILSIINSHIAAGDINFGVDTHQKHKNGQILTMLARCHYSAVNGGELTCVVLDITNSN